jgi:choline dehydrogenase-like flavoprotein
MAPYLRKFFTLREPANDTCQALGLDWIDDDSRGHAGPIQASFPEGLQDSFPRAWVENFKALGFPMTGDPFSGTFTGGFNNPITVDSATRERSYAAAAYFVPARGRPNLHVLTGSVVHKLDLKKGQDEVIACGVRFIHDGKTYAVKARKEVILAAGVFQSPKLLELSGIGSAKLLQSHGIPVLIDNPFVGENLQDHLVTGVSFEAKEGVQTADDLLRQDPAAVQDAMTAYQTSKAGPFCSAGVTSYAFIPLAEFLSSDRQETLAELLEQDGQSQAVPEHPADRLRKELVHHVLKTPEEAAAAIFSFSAQTTAGRDMEPMTLTANLLPGNFITLAVVLLHPRSTGNVHIMSSDPAQAPAIDPKYLSHPLDLEILARHVRYLETVAETPPLAFLLKQDGRRQAAGAYVKDLEAAKEHVRLGAVSNWHATGTCSMLPRGEGGVVNERLIVYGTRNLRVVDASIMPMVPQSNTQSSVYAIAERAADFIKVDHSGGSDGNAG